MMFLPPNVVPKQRCKRCTMHFDEDLDVCPHCDGLSAREVARIKRRLKNEGEGHHMVAYGMVAIAVIIALLVLNALIP